MPTMDLPRGALLGLLEQRFSSEHENRLHVFLLAALVVHLLHNEMVEHELLLARLHDTFYNDISTVPAMRREALPSAESLTMSLNTSTVFF